jgi:hypothetical protein
MATITEPGYMFSFTGELDAGEIHTKIKEALGDYIDNLEIEINVVKNRDDVFLGYSFLWTPCPKTFNLLIGNNADGTERSGMKDDPDWVEPVIPVPELSENWGDEVEYQDKITCPKIPYTLEPLLDLDIEIREASISENFNGYTDKRGNTFVKTNGIYCKNISEWVTNNDLKNIFKKYETDKITHIFKKEKFTYPKIERWGDNCTIIFSPGRPKTAYFLINMVKKLNFEKGGKKTMLFFSQTKKKNN